MEVTKSAHGVHHLQYHVIWVYKYRRKVLNPGVCSYLRRILPKLLRSMAGVNIETIGFDRDHLHMVIVIPPKYSIASVILSNRDTRSQVGDVEQHHRIRTPPERLTLDLILSK